MQLDIYFEFEYMIYIEARVVGDDFSIPCMHIQLLIRTRTVVFQVSTYLKAGLNMSSKYYIT